MRLSVCHSGSYETYSYLLFKFIDLLHVIKLYCLVQTVTTLPNFISWVLVYSVAFSLFNSTGMMNTLLLNLGLIKEPVLFLQS